jgi:5-methylthioadenosine/S-adenosylhomocysteine deaminase
LPACAGLPPVTPVDTLVSARWIVPVRPRAAVLEDHSIAVHGGRILAIVPTREAESRYRPGRHVQLPHHVITPGWINAHTHAAMTLLRGVGDDLPLMQWLNDRIWPLERALVSDPFVHDGTRLAALEMLRSGQTCASDMYFFPEAAARAMRAVGMRAVVGIIAIEFPTAYAADAEDYLRKGLATRDALRDDALTHFTLAPHAPYTVSDATLRRIATLAEELDLPVHTHVHETVHEVEESVRQHGMRPLARLERLGLVTERLIAVHAVHLQDSEIALLAQRGATIVHCPASNLKLASGFAPVASALRAGANVALGTDGAASNNRLDLVAEARLAALLAKGVSGDPAALPAWQVLECVTVNAARALALDDRIGTIEAGKEADLTAFDLSALETRPCFDPVSHLLYAASREHVSDVWVGGHHVVQTRQVVAETDGPGSATLMRSITAWQNSTRQFLKQRDA